MSELPTNEIIQRVLNIRYAEKTGTAFTVTKNNTQFLITAKHIFEDIINNSEITLDVLTLKGWVSIRVIFHMYSDEIDIAVLELQQPQYLTPLFNNNLLSTKGAIFGQDTYFYGFPHNIHMENATSFNNVYPMPLVKKACISAISSDLFPNCMLLDGINNPGFSGGPVSFYNTQTKSKNICAVIHGYVNEHIPVVNAENEFVKNNSGIIIAYDIKFAVRIISQILNIDEDETNFLG